jgi:spermidine/putrescine transport system permease protein
VNAVAVPARPTRTVAADVWAFIRKHVLTVYALLAFTYLLLPIAVVIAFSFNQPAGHFNYTWTKFTLDNWKNWDAVPGIRSAIDLSLEIGILASLCRHRRSCSARRS